ncbi:MAG: shikimate kinase [Bacteroidia bacterium]
MPLSENIFLTGFMGSGKTTAGKKLAKLLRLKFIDLDQFIEQKEKLTIRSLFENFGETAFRNIEQTCLNELLASEKSTVIALGGGTICYEKNLEKIKAKGCLIYIELPAITLVQRLEASKTERPLLKNLKGEDLVDFITTKLKEREIFYSAADIAISGLNLTPQLLQQKISEHKKKHN